MSARLEMVILRVAVVRDNPFTQTTSAAQQLHVCCPDITLANNATDVVISPEFTNSLTWQGLATDDTMMQPTEELQPVPLEEVCLDTKCLTVTILIHT